MKEPLMNVHAAHHAARHHLAHATGTKSSSGATQASGASADSSGFSGSQPVAVVKFSDAAVRASQENSANDGAAVAASK
jgi:hypothetical protein